MGTFTRRSVAPRQRVILFSSPPILKFPDFDREFVVHVDEGEEGAGAFLAQPSTSSTSDQDVDIIAYCSQRFKSGQRHYYASMRVFCVLLAITHWRPFFLFGQRFAVFTDHRALVYMQDTSTMLTCRAIALQNFDFTVKHVARKLNGCSRHTLSPVWKYQPRVASNDPALASTCRNVPNDRPYHRAGLRDFEISAQS